MWSPTEKKKRKTTTTLTLNFHTNFETQPGIADVCAIAGQVRVGLRRPKRRKRNVSPFTPSSSFIKTENRNQEMSTKCKKNLVRHLLHSKTPAIQHTFKNYITREIPLSKVSRAIIPPLHLPQIPLNPKKKEKKNSRNISLGKRNRDPFIMTTIDEYFSAWLPPVSVEYLKIVCMCVCVCFPAL